ncbi:MAG: ATP--guanido phosphotransferase, partial [Clostridiales bacterium]|nr:ATP--guanido phosphotransferase [Clostridiales bacterium]
KINGEQSKQLINDILKVFDNSDEIDGENYTYTDISQTGNIDKQIMLERHEISPELLRYERPRGVLYKDDGSVSIMINEEDHLRIQAVYPGNNIEKAYALADAIDDIIESHLEYSFNKDRGYLTSCPSNTGTGLRASVMMHLPMIKRSGNIQAMAGALAKIGMTARGIYGEGSKSYGSIYQISNQVTLGKSENEIIENLKTITEQIIDNEYNIIKTMFTTNALGLEDEIYRSAGILSNARKMSLSESMDLLSNIRLGLTAGLIKKDRLDKPVYNIMMDIKPGNIQKLLGCTMDDIQIDIERAKILREIFKGI